MAGIDMVGGEERIGKSPITTSYELLNWRAMDRKLQGLYQREFLIKGGGLLPIRPLHNRWASAIRC